MVRYLCIDGVSGGGRRSQSGQTAVRIPLALLRAGVKLHALIPDTAVGLPGALTDHDIDRSLRNLTESDIEHLVNAPDALEVAILRAGREKVRVYVE